MWVLLCLLLLLLLEVCLLLLLHPLSPYPPWQVVPLLPRLRPWGVSWLWLLVHLSQLPSHSRLPLRRRRMQRQRRRPLWWVVMVPVWWWHPSWPLPLHLQPQALRLLWWVLRLPPSSLFQAQWLHCHHHQHRQLW